MQFRRHAGRLQQPGRQPLDPEAAVGGQAEGQHTAPDRGVEFEAPGEVPHPPGIADPGKLEFHPAFEIAAQKPAHGLAWA